MNKIHSKVWSRSLGALVVAGEFARMKGKRGRRAPLAAPALVAGIMLALAAPVHAADAAKQPHAAGLAGAQGIPGPAVTANMVTAVDPYFAADGEGDGSDDASALGVRSTAAGAGSIADGEEASSYGAGSYAGDDYATAIGGAATAIGVGASVFGNAASTLADYATAVGASATADSERSLALGAFSQASAASAVALGAGSVADRANSVSVGSAGSERQITHVAAGTDATDAVNRAQLDLAIAGVGGGSNPLAVAFDDAGKGRISLLSGTGTVIANVAEGAVAAGSTEAVNGGQLHATNERVTLTEGAIAGHTNDIAALNQAIANVGTGGANPHFAADGESDGSDDASALGIRSTAAGAGSIADGEEASSYGAGSYAGDDYATAVGGAATAIGVGASAFGNAASTLADYATAVGASATADSERSLALGAFSQASAVSAVALGAGSVADRANSVSVGSAGSERQITHVAAGTDATDAVNRAQLDLAIAGVGGGNNPLAVAFDDASKGRISLLSGTGTVIANVAEGAVAAGSTEAVNGGQLHATNERVTLAESAIAGHTNDIAALNQAIADVDASSNPHFAADGESDGSDDASALGVRSTAAGASSIADGEEASSYGAGSYAGDDYATAVGGAATAIGVGASAFGNAASTLADYATAVGASATADSERSLALGAFSQASAVSAVALGAGSVADRANSVSVGSAGSERQITHVAAGTDATDAVNRAQLDLAIAGVAGGGSPLAVAYDDTDKELLTLAGNGGTRLGNLRASNVLSDAATVGQVDDLLGIIGGGAALQAGGSIGLPGFAIQGNSYDSIGGAFAALDGALSQAFSSIDALQSQVDQGIGGGSGRHVAIDGAGSGDDASVSTGSKGVAVGSGANAGGDHGTAVGGDSYAAGPNDTALGGNARVAADGSTAVGANSNVTAAATNAVAVGEGASVSAASGTALGQGSKTTAAGAVALGQGSVADQADTVSVGNASQQRRIVNVAAGTAGTDAANVAQLDAGVQDAIAQGKAYTDANAVTTLNNAKSYTDKRIAEANWQFDRLRGEVDRRFRAVDARIDRVNAMGAASTQMAINAAGASGSGRLAAGVGFSGGRSALSVGYGAPLGERTRISFGATASGSESSAGIGFGVDL